MPLSYLFRIGRLKNAQSLLIFPSLPSRLQPCASMRKQSQSPLSNPKGSSHLADSSLLGFFTSVIKRRGYNHAFPVSPALPAAIACFGTIQKKASRVRDVFERSKVGEGWSFSGRKPAYWGFFISVIMRRGYSRAFSRSSALGRLEPARHCGGFAPKWAFCFAK